MTKKKMISIYIKNFFYILRVKWLVKNGCRHNCFLCRYSYECFTQLMYEKEGAKNVSKKGKK
jgi:hypothetical protein